MDTKFTYEKAAGGFAVREGKNVVALVLSELLAVFFCQAANARREKAERRGPRIGRPSASPLQGPDTRN